MKFCLLTFGLAACPAEVTAVVVVRRLSLEYVSQFLMEILLQNSATTSGTPQCLLVPGVHLLSSPLKYCLVRNSLSRSNTSGAQMLLLGNKADYGDKLMHGVRISHIYLYSVGRHI